MAAKSRDNRVNNLIWGVLLSLAGVGLLLFNLDVFVQFEPYVQYGAAALLGLLALLFVGGYLSARENWWRLIPGWTLIALTAMVYLTTLPALDQRITASVLFVGQAIAFAHIYLLDRAERWWAIIPGGFMLMLGGTIALSSLTEEPAVLGTVLFIGLGAVFFSALHAGTAVAAVVGAGSGLRAGAVGPLSFFGWPGSGESSAAFVAGAAAVVGCVADLAGDASAARPQAECGCRAR